jgi:hypothetical protein
MLVDPTGQFPWALFLLLLLLPEQLEGEGSSFAEQASWAIAAEVAGFVAASV